MATVAAPIGRSVWHPKAGGISDALRISDVSQENGDNGAGFGAPPDPAAAAGQQQLRRSAPALTGAMGRAHDPATARAAGGSFKPCGY